MTAVPGWKSRHAGVVFITSSWAGSGFFDMESGSLGPGRTELTDEVETGGDISGASEGGWSFGRWVSDELFPERNPFFFFLYFLPLWV